MNTFINLNVCRTFNQIATTVLTPLSAQICSEVVIYNQSGNQVLIYDNYYANPSNAMLLNNGDSFIVRGITDTACVSAQTVAGSGPIYYRAQYWSSNVTM